MKKKERKEESGSEEETRERHSLSFKGYTFPYKWLVVNNVNVPP